MSSNLVVQTGGAADSLTISESISGPGEALSVYGSGNLVLSGDNTYGDTDVEGGRLEVMNRTPYPPGRA